MRITRTARIIQSVFFILLSMAIFSVNAHVLQSKDAKAHKWFNEQKYAKAALEFKSPDWKGVSWYKAGDFEKAVEQLKESKDITSVYNLGNAYAKLGKYQEAIDAYDAVLKNDPKHEDAAYNKQLVLEQMDKNQEENQQKSDQNNQNDKKQSEDKNNKNDKDNNEKDKDKGKGKNDTNQQDSQPNKEQEDANNKPDNQPGSNQSNQSDHSLGAKQNDDSLPKDENDSSNKNKTDNMSENKNDEVSQKNDNQNINEINKSKNENVEKLSPEQENKWLSRIQDDPGGLLRRKFQYQYLASEQEVDEGEPAW